MPTERFSRVLVVEDSPDDLQLLCDILQGEGFRVIGCGSAHEGLSHVRQHIFGVAIIDLRLPDLTGTQLLEKIREHDDQVRVIIYTGAASFDSIKEALNLGAFAYVEKLSDPSELLRHVHRACRERVDRYALDLEQAVAERTEELARSNSALENFAFIVAHDLRSPLLTISGYSQILQEDYTQHLDEAALEYLQQIVKGVTRMSRMIDDLLDYSRAGRSEQPLAPVDVQSVMTQTVANLEASIRAQGARINVGPLPLVLGDEMQLVQLFQNLVGNAIKFRREIAPVVGIAATPHDGQCEFTISDNGVGIDAAHFPQLFAIFHRLHGQDYPGTGIGLAICKKIVERHGGRIWLESAVGEGTTFHFTLPMVDHQRTGHLPQ